jgi:hypothetical protein
MGTSLPFRRRDKPRKERVRRTGTPVEVSDLYSDTRGKRSKWELTVWTCPDHGEQPRYRNQCYTCGRRRG